MKIKSITQLIDLVRNERVNFTQTPQIDGTDIIAGPSVKLYKNPPDPVSLMKILQIPALLREMQRQQGQQFL